MAEKPRIVGIDLGTTNTLVASVRNRIPKVVPTDRGNLVLPSVVALSEKGDLLVGKMAKDQMVVNPKNTVYGTKRLIGRQYASRVVQELKEYFTYDILEGKKGDVAVNLGGTTYSLRGDRRLHPGPRQAHRRAVPRRPVPRGGHLGPRLLQRQPARGGEGGRAAGGLRGEADRQRAHRRGAGLRLQPRAGSERPGLRPGRRDVRRLGAADHRQRLRGAGDRRRHLPRRRGLRQPDHRLRAGDLPAADPRWT